MGGRHMTSACRRALSTSSGYTRPVGLPRSSSPTTIVPPSPLANATSVSAKASTSRSGKYSTSWPGPAFKIVVVIIRSPLALPLRCLQPLHPPLLLQALPLLPFQSSYRHWLPPLPPSVHSLQDWLPAAPARPTDRHRPAR